MLLHSARLIEHPPWWKGSAQARADPHVLLFVRWLGSHLAESGSVAFVDVFLLPLLSFTSHDRFGFLHFPLCHSSETRSGRSPTHTPSTVLHWQSNSKGTLCMQHSTPLDIKYRSCSSQNLLSFTLQRTSSGGWTYSSSLSALHPGHPAAPGFKRSRAASWCLFELCVKYRYRKSPQGQTHKALTVSSWVLVPITHLRGLFSCQLPRRNSQLRDFKKSLSGAGVDWQPKLPLWLRLSAKHTRPSVPLKKTVVKKKKRNWIIVEMT